MVRSFVGGLELIVSLLKSNDREVFSYITPLTLDTLTSVFIFSILFHILPYISKEADKENLFYNQYLP